MSDVCPECIAAIHAMHGGSSMDSPEQAAEKIARSEADALVEVAQIEKERDIALAKIAAGAIDREAEVEVAVAEAELEVAEDALDAATAEPEPEPATVVVNSDPPEDEPEAAELPEAEAPEDIPEPDTHRGYGSSAWFGR